MNAPTERAGYGSFVAGVLNLALPLSAIREVQPLHDLMPLPCTAKGLMGGLNLRGVVVPVIDLCQLLGFSVAPDKADSIVVVAASGRLIGMTANRVNELFYVDALDINPIHLEGDQPPLFIGSVSCPTSGTLLNVLEPENLVTLRGLPSAKDPQPQRVLGMSDADLADSRQSVQGESFMLLSSGQIRYAINPTQVESTLSNPDIKASSLCGGHFMGELQYRGQCIPAVNLNQACGFKNEGDQASLREACVVRLKEGAVAFMVDRVVDMVTVNPGHFSPLSPDQSSVLSLVDQVMPNSLLGETFVNKHLCAGLTHFVLNGQLIQSDRALNELASLLAKRRVENGAQQGHLATARGEYVQESRFLTYVVHEELATPIETVVKVIPFNPAIEILSGQAALMGYVFDQGENIRVYSLSCLLTGKRQSLGTHSSILIVQCGGGKVGFAVRSLKTIESARWKNTIPVLGVQRDAPGNFGQTSHPHVEIGSGHEKRMLRVLDLIAIGTNQTSGQVVQPDASLDVLNLLPELLDQHL